MIALRIVRPICLMTLAACIACAAASVAIGAGDADSVATASESAAAGASGLDPTTAALIASLTIFVLAMFEGFDVITKVPPTLHTALMSGSNAISGITIVGALVAAGSKHVLAANLLGMVAVAFAMINVVGGFLVTHRMLKMFKTK